MSKQRRTNEVSHKPRAKRRLLHVLLASASGIFAPAIAQAADTNSTGEVVITAQRRNERMQDVPVAVTTLNSAQLERAGISGSKELTQVTPGLNFTQSIYSPQPTIRGIGTRGVGSGDESVVPIYIDGVYQAFIPAGDFQLNDVQRIEVLKGPQGALFGRNATGGAVNIVTKRPAEGFSGESSVSYGRFNQVIGKLYATGGADKLAADIALLYSHDDGYITDIGSVNHGQKYGYMHDFSGRASVRFDPTENSEFHLAYSHTVDKDATASANLPTNGNTAAVQVFPTVFVDRQLYTAALDMAPTNDVWQDAVSLTGVVHAGPLDLNSVTGWAKNKFNATADSDATTAPSSDIRVAQGDTSFYQELYAASNFKGPLSFIGGLTYFHDLAESGPKFGDATTLSTSTCTTRDPVTHLCTTPGPVSHLIGVSALKTNSYAAYLQGTYKLTDSLSLTLAGRVTSEERHITTQSLSPAGAVLTGQHTWHKFTPSGNLDWRVSPKVNLYLKGGEAFKSGLLQSFVVGAIPGSPGAPPSTVNEVKPEDVVQWEIGAKTNPTSRLRVNVAGYYTEYRNLQASVRYFNQAITQNIPQAIIYGGEIEGVFRALDNLNLNFGVSLLHGTYTQTDPIAPVSINPPKSTATCLATYGIAPCGNDTVGANVKGNSIVRTPFMTFNVGGDYTVELPYGDLIVSGNVYQSGKSYWDLANRVVQPPYTLINSQVTWKLPDDKTSFTLWGENLTDQVYNTTVGTSANDSFDLARPRTYGVRVGYKW